MNELSIKEKNRIFNSIYWIIGYIVITVILTYIANKRLFPVATEQIGGDLAADVLEQMIEAVRPNRWTIYIKKPLLLILRMAVVSGALYSGFIINTTIKDKKFISCWTIGVKSVLSLMLFYIGITIYNSVNMQIDTDSFYYSISLLRWFNTPDLKENATWLFIILLSVNLQEIVYVLFITFLVHREFHFSFGNSLIFVLKTYGVLLLLGLLICVIISI